MKNYLFKLVCCTLFMTSAASADITSHLTHFSNLECSLKLREVEKKGRPHPHMSVEQGASTNWSGYASATNLNQPINNTVTTVSGTWIVPTLKATADETYTAIWVGIDGYNSGTVEQLGTEHDWVSGKQVNSAWFEMYPHPSYDITGFPMKSGDVIQAEVDYKGNNQFHLSIVNHTQNFYSVIPASYTKSTVAKRSSAEWIVEAPYLSSILPLSDFQTISFLNCETTIKGVKGGIQNPHWQAEALIMQADNGVVKAIPSPLSPNNESFFVQWNHE